MKTRKRDGSTFKAAKAATAPLAIRPSALSLFWLFGCERENETHGRVSIVTVEGPLEQRSSWWDGYDRVLARFREALGDEHTSTVLLRLDSPGGECAGLFECVRQMREAAAASGKRIVAYADEHAYSAAYALACVADEIYLPRAGGIGSVGVIAVCLDRTARNVDDGYRVEVVHAGERKADCHPDKALSDDAIAGVRDHVEALADMFYELVADARGVELEAVVSLEAACFMGDDAVAADLADGVMGYAELLAMLEADDNGAEAPSTKEAAAMVIKTKAGASTKIKASEVEATDALAKPQVAAPAPELMAATAAALGKDEPGKPGKPAATSEATEEETDEDTSAEGDDEETDDEEETDEDTSAAAPSPAPGARRASTTGAVLRLVREITGESSPASQIGALTALRDKAKRADVEAKRSAKLAAKAKGAELKTLVDGAVRAGKLAPSQRAWAMAAGLDVVRGYLKNADPVVRTSPLRQKATKGPNGAEPSTPGASPVDEAIANVARTMQLDPAAVQAHAAELRSRGVIH